VIQWSSGSTSPPPTTARHSAPPMGGAPGRAAWRGRGLPGAMRPVVGAGVKGADGRDSEGPAPRLLTSCNRYVP
jgi:hypothetical protein